MPKNAPVQQTNEHDVAIARIRAKTRIVLASIFFFAPILTTVLFRVLP